MLRRDAYAGGFHAGRLWAEEDIAAHVRSEPLRDFGGMSDAGRAEQIGYVRGYRDTWARWDSGALTWEMLEHAPVNR